MSHTRRYKTIAFMLIFSLVVALLPAVASATDTTWPDTSVNPTVYWHYKDKGSTIEVDGCGFSGSSAIYDTLTIPSTINGKPVTSIVNVFNTISNFLHLVIPASVTNIGEEAVYYCPNVQSITIQGNVTNIGEAAFRSCNALQTVNIPSTVTTIGKLAFADCANLSGNITIPSGVSVLNDSVFNGCKLLTGITLSEGLATISGCAFQDCTGLTSLALPASVTNISLGAFYGCTNLASFTVSSANTTYSSQGGVLYNKAKTASFLCPPGKTGTVAIPTSVTTVDEFSFGYCAILTGITIPDNVTSIKAMAFMGCSGLNTLTIPSSVKTIGEGAFSSCSGLKSLILPASATSIDDCAFEYCTGLTSFTLPDGVTTVGVGMFSGCTGLTSVTLPSSISSIKEYAFTGCTALTKCLFKGNVPVIASSAYPAQGFTAYYHLGDSTWATYNTQPKQAYCYGTTDLQDGSATATKMYDMVSGHVASPAAPTRTGYTFGGWYKQAACTNAWNFTTDTITGDFTAYAKWVAIPYAVIFNSQGGSPVAGMTVPYNTTITTPAAPTRTGYTFGGWYKEAACTNAWNFTTKITGNVTLYAKWNIVTFTVTFNTLGGNTVVSKTAPYNTLITAPAAPTRTGYTFGGWYKQAACTTAWNFATDKVTAATTLFAKWKVNSYTVTFNAQGGSTVASKTAQYNTTITAPAAPTRTGYTFGGWYRQSACTTAWNFATYKVTVAITLYAKWTALPPTAPASVSPVSSSYNSVTVTWTAAAYASGYEVWRATSTTGVYTLTGKSTGTRFSDGGLTTGTTYYYKIRAYRTAGSSTLYGGYSPIKSAKPVPAAPASVKAASVTYSSVKLTWGAVLGASGYEVYRATSSGGTYTKLPGTSSAAYTATGLTPGKSYYFKVRAYRTVNNAKVYGGYSSIISAKAVPSTPGGVKAARVSDSSVKVSWSVVASASGYEVYRSTSKTGTYALAGSIAKGSIVSYTNTKLTDKKTYYYIVRAYNLVGSVKVYGAFSVIVSATT